MAKRRGSKKSGKRRPHGGNGHGTAGRFSVNLGGALQLGGLGSAAFRPVEQMQNTAFAQMQAAYNKKQQIEMAGLNAEQRRLQREMEERMGDMQEQQAEQRTKSEKEMRKKGAENAEKFAEQRAEMAKNQRKLQRDMSKKATEQRDKIEDQQLEMSKKAADQQLKMAEEWAKSAASMGAVAFNFPSAASGTALDPTGRPAH